MAGGFDARILLAGALVLAASCAHYEAAPLQPTSVEERLAPPAMAAVRVRGMELEHPLLKPITIDLDNGLSPDEAAVLSVLLNPALNVLRDQRGIAEAQLLQAGLLPNPQLGFSLDAPTGGATQGTVNAFGLDFGWDVLRSLLTRGAAIDAARGRVASVDLDVAWNEWQVAQSARLAVYRLRIVRQQLAVAREEEKLLTDNVQTVRRAVDRHDKTIVDLAAAEAALRNTQDTVLALAQRNEEQRLSLNRAIGLSPERDVPLEAGIEPPGLEKTPSLQEIMARIEQRRLDLVAFQLGYQSQEARLRAAIRAQFPSIHIGVAELRDTGDVVTTGFGVTIDLPFFDRNQGRIALERASRKALFDEYTQRLFDARSQGALILADIASLREQIGAGERSVRALASLVDVYHQALLEGDADVLTYYNARKDMTSKQVDVLALRSRLADLTIALELTAGRYLESGAQP